MHVKVLGKQVEIAVSEGGMFYDAETKTISAPTLKGLQKKLIKHLSPQSSLHTPIEDHSGKKGVIIGRNTGTKSYYAKRYFRVRWEGSEAVTLHNGYELYRPTTTEERKELDRLSKKAEAAREAYQTASHELTTYKGTLLAGDSLEQLYPVH